jgi:hypothetical protein
MAESPEHAYLSQTFLTVLNKFSRSQLYTYRESDRGKFDIACVLAEAWDCVLNGQTLWKHTEGIDKDLRTLLVASDAPLVTYVARDTTKHRSVIAEAMNDYRRFRQGPNFKHFRVFWVPTDFDADSEKERHLVGSQLEHEITEDILLNVLFGRLTASRVHAVAVMKPSTTNLGLELAILRSIAVNGFISFSSIGHEFKVSSGTVRERIYRLQMSGLILQERSVGEGYYVGSAGRAFLRLCAQLHKLVRDRLPLTAESTEILKTLGAEPFDLKQYGDYFDGSGDRDRFDPKSVFFLWVGKVHYAAQIYGFDWDQCDYRYSDDEQDTARWLTL